MANMKRILVLLIGGVVSYEIIDHYNNYRINDLTKNGKQASCFSKLKIPEHVSIIMDGNGRWAKKKGFDRTYGHSHADTAIENSVEMCIKLGVKYLSLYAFSTENWKRPKEEINNIFKIIEDWIHVNKQKILDNEIKVLYCGDISQIPPACQDSIIDLVKKTRNNGRLTIVVYVNYSGRWDVVQAVNKIINDRYNYITYDDIEQMLSTKNIPDPDIVIRTGNMHRLSNFTLLQMAYSELFFCKKMWPDFNKKDFCKIILEYQKRNRTFGGLK